jgi:hypothetical protein
LSLKKTDHPVKKCIDAVDVEGMIRIREHEGGAGILQIDVSIWYLM